MSKTKIFFIGLIPGLIIGSAAATLIMMPKKSDLAKIKTTQISGEKISHEKWNFKGSNVSFNTVSEGKGEINTEIPKTLVPEASAWMNRTTAIGFLFSEKYVPGTKTAVTGIGLSFHKRWGSVDFGGGPLAEFTTESNPKFYSFGVFVEAKYWFQLPRSKVGM